MKRRKGVLLAWPDGLDSFAWVNTLDKERWPESLWRTVSSYWMTSKNNIKTWSCQCRKVLLGKQKNIQWMLSCSFGKEQFTLEIN